MSIMKSLQARAKEMQNSLPFMEGKEKGEMKRIVDMNATIREYGFLKDDQEKEYVCFIIDEDPNNFYFGGQVLTENMRTFEDEGYHEEIVKDGLPVLFGLRMSKKNKEYVTVSFYPEPVTPKTKSKSKTK